MKIEKQTETKIIGITFTLSEEEARDFLRDIGAVRPASSAGSPRRAIYLGLRAELNVP